MSYGHFMVTFVVCLISTIAAVPVAHLTGFQGQLCVFEATPNRVYNLISTPLLQVNGRFVTVEDTMQVDQLGIAMLDRRLQIVSGPQSTGFAIVKMIPTHGITLQPEQTYTLREENGSPIVLKYVSNDHIQLKTEQFTIIISNVNSYLMMDVVWNDKAVLKLGQSQQTIDDPQLCQTLLNSRVGKKHTKMTPGVVRTLFHQLSHGNDIPVHGLIGQSWRNVVTCGNAWMGGSQDYEASSIFATDYTFKSSVGMGMGMGISHPWMYRTISHLTCLCHMHLLLNRCVCALDCTCGVAIIQPSETTQSWSEYIGPISWNISCCFDVIVDDDLESHLMRISTIN